ncbi:MAG: archaeosine biosynthesis radical SAM protein RaSEA [Thermoplasmata archaeon]
MTDDDHRHPIESEQRRRRRSPREPVSVWKEKENLGGEVVDAGVVILRTSGCAHSRGGGCTMCGYNQESSEGISSEDVIAQFRSASKSLNGTQFLKVYTSGSFLDQREMPLDAQREILSWCRDGGRGLLFESRTEFITDDGLGAALQVHDDIEVAIGLESANDRVLKFAINKDMTVADYDRAASAVKSAGARLRSYVLLKPPYLTEAEAIEDAISTAKHAALMSDTISINPVNVQRGTIVERLWKSWSYRSPWLWSVIEVLNACTELDRKVVCDPTGGGRERGAHNCGGCDEEALSAIREFSLTQSRNKIQVSECECHGLWETIRELEGLIVGGTPDLQRFYRSKHAR